jgi:hypothetical protein
MLEVHHLVIAPDNAVPDHLRRPAPFRHLVCVQSFSQAGSAVGSVRVFKTRAQTGVALSAIAVAVAWHLVHHAAGPDGCFVAFGLYRLVVTLIQELFLCQDRRELFASCWRRRMKSREFLWAVHLCLNGSGQEDGANREYVFHNDSYFNSREFQVV